MNPHEHYQEAERLLERANDPDMQSEYNRDRLIAMAQVHATLAAALNPKEYPIDIA